MKLSCNISHLFFEGLLVSPKKPLRIYKQLGDTARPDQWWKQGWFEHNPVQNNATVLGISPSASSPISSMSDEAWEQQPCNAFSNAAFFEISIQACKTASASDVRWMWGPGSRVHHFFWGGLPISFKNQK